MLAVGGGVEVVSAPEVAVVAGGVAVGVGELGLDVLLLAHGGYWVLGIGH